MRKLHIGFAWVAALLLVGSLGACRIRPINPDPVQAYLGEPFWLRVGQTVNIVNQPLQITFREVLQDSRCPSDVVCIWEGEVVLALEAKSGDTIETLQFNVRGGGVEDTEQFGPYSITVLQVAPPRGKLDAPPPLQSYSAQIVVNLAQ